MLNSMFKNSLKVTAVTKASRATNVLPQLEVLSTKGKLKITGAVSKALKLKAGDFITLASNLEGIQDLLANPTPELENFIGSPECEAQFGKTFESVEDVEFQKAFESEMVEWYIAKGYALYTKDGKPVMTKDKATKENIHKHMGSRAACKNSTDGYGNPLEFQDASSYATLKADLIADGTSEKTVRIFTVDLDNAFNSEAHNGLELVDVVYYPINVKEYEDREAVERKPKAKTDAVTTDQTTEEGTDSAEA